MLITGMLLLVSMMSSLVASDEVKGFFDLNFYPYTEERADNIFTLNVLAKFSRGFEYFSLTNVGRESPKNDYDEINFLLSEQNIRWMVPRTSEIVQLATQALVRDESNNEAFRFGPRLAFHNIPLVQNVLAAVNAKYWISFYGAQYDEVRSGYRWQMEHVFRVTLFPKTFSNRVYLGGFADHNISHDNGTTHTWLQEAQVGVRLFQDFYAVIEQRYNEFQRGNESSMGLGLEYIIRM